jgi:hypothetical protein
VPAGDKVNEHVRQRTQNAPAKDESGSHSVEPGFKPLGQTLFPASQMLIFAVASSD